ncbi:hypothetical protein ACH40E_15895, partial [Streptomyces acidicola]|uniref:hypothetical protein n=1 Tax=Streptomyces acidicola TaxID=2596892 RepID=UPI003788246B
LPVPSLPWGLPPPDPRIGLNGLVLKRRTGWGWGLGCVGLYGLVLKRRTGWGWGLGCVGLYGLVLKLRMG